MEFPGQYPGEFLTGVPVVLNSQRPHRNRPRVASEHHQRLYIQDANGLLFPATSHGAGLHRSNSAAGPRSAPVVFNDFHLENLSPERKSRRRSSREQHYSSDEDWDDRACSHERRRPRSRSCQHRHKSPSPSPLDPETEKRMQRLEDFERKEAEEQARQKYEEERMIAKAKKAKEDKELEALKELTIKEHNAKVLEEELKKKRQKEEEDKAFQERMRATMLKAGYSEESIEETLNEQGKKGDKPHSKKIMDITRPTYIKVHRKHLSPDTLDLYELPWEWDDRDPNYILIKRWIPEHDQDILFEHTRRLREGRLLTNATVEIKKERDNLLLVRKKSPNRRRSRSRSYVLT